MFCQKLIQEAADQSFFVAHTNTALNDYKFFDTNLLDDVSEVLEVGRVGFGYMSELGTDTVLPESDELDSHGGVDVVQPTCGALDDLRGVVLAGDHEEANFVEALPLGQILDRLEDGGVVAPRHLHVHGRI